MRHDGTLGYQSCVDISKESLCVCSNLFKRTFFDPTEICGDWGQRRLCAETILQSNGLLFHESWIGIQQIHFKRQIGILSWEILKYYADLKIPIVGVTFEERDGPHVYQDGNRWMDLMRQSIAFNASFFSTQ